ncbi:winged helix-turn-helix domain-containing protein [Natrinema gelatinilyticum]|uniref:winged helix-turn-helix domain-containing protein n=1 Tax=Natrinema gelatinilyticum TaxID=2961571 RepID=UPI0020C57C12|nr:helix-turn-helix domain-containing protein [Natrinema gelatinilyticum]
MAHSPPRSGQPPIQQLQTVADLLETPTLARIYAHILHHDLVTVSEIVDELDIPQGTAYDYIQKLETAGLVEKTREQRPYEYDAESISLTLSTNGETQTITPTLIAAIARRAEDDDIDVYIERHGLDGLAVALEYAYEYVDGTVNHRIAARELDLSPLEAEIILQALEPVAIEYADTSRSRANAD